jgi:hypothetical protein
MTGEALVKLINDCYLSGKKHYSILITKSYRTIKKAVLKAVLSDYRIVKCMIPYPDSLFLQAETAAVGVHLDILQIAAEILLRFKPAYVALQPTIAYNEKKERIYSDMASGIAYESCYESIKKKFGSDVYPLCICISGDEVQINKKGSMGCKPWYVSIANIKAEFHHDSKNIECIGYSPDWLHTKVYAFVICLRCMYLKHVSETCI